MSIRSDTLRITRELRAAVNAAADDEARALARAWARAWDGIVHEFQSAADAIAARAVGGEPITIGMVRRMDRARRAVDTAQHSIEKILARQEPRVRTVVSDLVDATARLNARQIGSQLPRREGTPAELAIRFDRVNADALDAIVRRSTQRVTSRRLPLSASANEAMLRSLVRAIPEGASPRAAAARMVRDAEGAFNGGLSRALTVARTEILDAYRSGAMAQQLANRDVLAGWVWTAQLDARTCPSCVAEHGTEHPLEEFGPDDHQNGRCARTPLVKPWSELGISLAEPPSLITPGPQWFDDQSEDVQRRIMGDRRLAGLRDGQIGWDDISTRRRTTGWRDAMVPTALKDLDLDEAVA